MHAPQQQRPQPTIAIIVAHPDDETLWCGGTLLENPSWDPFICCLCRGKDPDRAPRFTRALKRLNARGAMGDLDDDPAQTPVSEFRISEIILSLLPKQTFDVIYTHSPEGEYTNHLRHEEIGKTVISLWAKQQISTKELRQFAYEDGNRQYRTRAITENTLKTQLSRQTWTEKLAIITDIYGFDRSSWEAQATPELEAFHCFHSPKEAETYFALEPTPASPKRSTN